MIKYTKDDMAFLKYRHAEQRRSDESMDGKVCVISGATSGVGLEAAKRLAQGGCELVLISRSLEKAQRSPCSCRSLRPPRAPSLLH